MTVFNPTGSGGGGTPGGSPTNLQFNDSGTFGGLIDSTVNNTDGFLGLNEATPLYTLDVTSRGTIIDPPTSFSVTPTTEIVATNVSGSAVVIDGPADSSTASLGVPTQVDDVFGVYFADGSTNITYYIFAYKLINGTFYYFGTPSSNTFTDNNDGQNFYVALSWSVVTNADGYILAASGSANTGNPNFYIDVGNVTSFNDFGSNSGSVSPQSWSTIAYPYNSFVPVADNPNSFSGFPNTGYSNYPDDGSISYIHYDIYAYDNSHSPTYYSNFSTVGDIYPPGLGGTFGPDLFWASGGSQSGFKIIITVHYVSLPDEIGSYDNGNSTSFANLAANSSDVTITPSISSYSPYTTRNYESYGIKSSPVTSYSSSHTSYSATDSNPVQGYIIQHTLVYAGADPAKLVGNSDGTLTAGHLTSATSLYETNSGFWTTDSTVTPIHYGIESLGQTYNFRVYTYQSSPVLYSSTYLAGSYAFPNDGVYRFLNTSWTDASGFTNNKFLIDTGTGFNTGLFTDSPLTIYSYTNFGDGTIVTPNIIDSSTSRFKSSTSTLGGAAQVLIQSTDASNPTTKVDWLDNTGTSKAYDAVYGGSRIFNTTNAAQSYSFRGNSLEHTRFSNTQALFNQTAQAGFQFSVSNSIGSYNIFANDTYAWLPRSRNYIGANNTDTGALLTLSTASSNDNALYMPLQSGTGYALRIESSGFGIFTVSREGKTMIARNGINGAWLGIGSGTTTTAPIIFDSGTLNTTAQTGGMEYNGTNLFFTPTGTTRQRFVLGPTTSMSNNFYTRVDSNGNLVTGNIQDQSGVVTAFSLVISATQGLSISSGQALTMGAGATYSGGIRTTYATRTTSGTLSVTNNSPITVFTGSTAAQTLTLPTAASISGTVFEISNEASVNVTVATTSSQNMNIGTGTQTTLVLAPGDRVKFIATASSTWDVASYTQWLLPNARLINSTISGIALGSNLANLTATDTTLTFSGTYTGGTARTIGLNLGNANTWTGKQSFGTPINEKNYTVATLPTGVRGDRCYVTDALLPTFLATLVGGGAVVCPAFYDGTNWVAA